MIVSKNTKLWRNSVDNWKWKDAARRRFIHNKAPLTSLFLLLLLALLVILAPTLVVIYIY